LEFSELLEYIKTGSITVENYKPVTLRKILLSKGATRKEIEEELKIHNPDSESQSMTNTVLTVLQKESRKIIKKENGKYILNLSQELLPEQVKEIVDECNKKIESFKPNTKNSNVWVWPVDQPNWPTVKEKKVWAVGKKGKGSRVKPGDKIIFYLKGKGFFVGVFNVKSEWHERTIVWPDQIHGSEIMETGSEIDLEIIQLGFASWAELFPNLKFVERKSPLVRGLYLRGTSQGPANSARPISQEDYDLIFEELIKNQKEPIITKVVEDDEVEELVDISEHEFEMERLPEPEKKSIEDIFKDVENGRYAIPKFQRYWTWTTTQIEELWESIFRSYYIGSLLYWEVGAEKLGSTPVEGAPNTAKDASYILDGQQRITAIYYAIKAPEISLPKTTYPYVFFLNINALLDPNRDSSEIIDSYRIDVAKSKKYFEQKTQFTKKVFPLSELKNNSGSNWLFNFQDYLQDDEEFSKEEARKVHQKLDAILGYVWSKYEIPVVNLSKTLSDVNVIKVFERINSRGTVLDVFDLLNARFALYKIDLKSEWEKVESIHKNLEKWYKKNDKIPIYILQSISLVKKGYLRRSQLLTIDEAYKVSGNFDNDEFLKDWNEMARFVEESIKRLTDTRFGFGAINYNQIPYTVMVPILAALLKTIADREDKTSCMEKISLWYWNTISGDNYSGSTDSKGELDYKNMKEWFDNPNERPFNNMPVEDFNISKTSSAIYKGIMCLIAKKGALDFVENDPPNYSKLEDHHIFPKSKAVRYNAKGNINSILNRTLIFEKTNGWITNKDPSNYLKEIMTKQGIDEKEMRRRLETHLISSEAFDCMLKNDFEGFIKERKKTVIIEMNKNTGTQMNEIPTQTSPDTRFSNVRMLRNRVESCKEALYWVDKYFAIKDFDIIQDGTAENNVQKINILISKQKIDEKMKSDFKSFKKEMKIKRNIECSMKIMSKEVSDEIHDRYIIGSNVSYNIVSGDVARRGQTGDNLECSRPDIEKWWADSYDVIEDWNKFTTDK
jgi:hypothetical protein